MTRRIRIGLGAALCVVGAAACDGANGFTGPGLGAGGIGGQPNSQLGAITGTVTANGQGLGGISVLVSNRDSTVTNGLGQYALTNLGPATYSVSIRVPINYTLAAGEENPRTVTVAAGSSTNASWQLRETTTVP